MLINAIYKNGAWTVNENDAMLIPEFRELLKDAKYGVEALAFVAIYADPSSFLAEIYEDDKERYHEAIRSVYNDTVPSILKTAKIKAAIERYQKISNNSSVKLRQQIKDGIKKAGNFIDSSGDALDKDNITSFMATLKAMPSLVDTYSDMNKGKKDDLEETKKIVRGGRELTFREQKKKKK